MSETIIITPRSLSKGESPEIEKLRNLGYNIVFPSPGNQPSEKDIKENIKDAVGYIAGVEKITSSILENAKKLRVISRNGVGVDNIDIAYCKEHGITVRRAEGVNAISVAELAIGHMITAARHITESDNAIKQNGWQRQKGFELHGKTLGILGCGRIGKHVASIALGFGMKVLAYDVFEDRNFSPSVHFIYTSFDNVIKNSDIITLHAPMPENDRALIDKKVISEMKDGVIVVNTAREKLCDENALIEALENGKISFYTIDAFETEPPKAFTLASHKKVLATAHIGAFTDESIEKATTAAVDNLIKELEK